jgi:hypothetical protein
MTDPVGAGPDIPPKLPRWRRVLVAVLVILSVVLAPLGVVAIFVRNLVLDTDTYVETVAPLAHDPDIVQAAADRLTDRLFESVDVEERIEVALPDRAQFLAGTLATALEGVTRDAALRLLESDQFQTFWEKANRRAHSLVQAALTGEGTDAVGIEDGHVVLDMKPLLRQVRERLQDRGVTVFDNVEFDRDLAFELFDASSIESAQGIVRLLDKAAWYLEILALAFLAVALALSGNRRRTLIRWGIGLFVAMAVTAIAIALSRNAYLNSVASDDLSRSAAGSAFDILVRFLRNAVRVLAVIGILVALGALLVGDSRIALRTRATARRLVTGRSEGAPGWLPPGFGRFIADHKNPLRLLGLAVVVLLLLSWDRPRPITVLVLVVILVVYLALLELLGRGPKDDAAAEPAADVAPADKGSDGGS